VVGMGLSCRQHGKCLLQDSWCRPQLLLRLLLHTKGTLGLTTEMECHAWTAAGPGAEGFCTCGTVLLLYLAAPWVVCLALCHSMLVELPPLLLLLHASLTLVVVKGLVF
jgi:hypothetical protein